VLPVSFCHYSSADLTIPFLFAAFVKAGALGLRFLCRLVGWAGGLVGWWGGLGDPIATRPDQVFGLTSVWPDKCLAGGKKIRKCQDGRRA